MNWRAGDHYVICDRCARKVYASTTAKEWTGAIVCRIGCFEERHPQEFVRGVHDRQRVPMPRPEDVGHGLRMDITTVRIDDTFIPVDPVGDDFIEPNEITAADL